MSFVYYEGVFLPLEEAKIPLTDRGFLFGDGVYATIKVEEGRALYLDRHLSRLESQCTSFGLKAPTISPSLIEELIRLNHAKQATWRLKIIVTGGDNPAFHLPRREGRIVMTLNRYEEPARHPLKIGIFPHPFHLCHAYFKSLAHLNRFYVMEYAKQKKFDDCLTLKEDGTVLEMAFGNICWVVEKTLYTPSRKLPLYFGVTLSELIDRMVAKGYDIKEVEIAYQDLPRQAAYFRTNSMGGIWPIREIGTIQVEEGDLHTVCLA